MIDIPVIETARLRLRAPEARDFDAYAAFRGSDRARALGGPFTREQAFTQFSALIGHWVMRGFGRWIVADKASDAPLGVVGILYPEGWPEPELAWSLFDGAEGRGVAHEAAAAARDHAYGPLGMTTLISLVASDNPRSEALARRLGARPDGSRAVPGHGATPVWRHPSPEALT
jgi:ribosomal-protein-alanine N-acetyltransferase